MTCIREHPEEAAVIGADTEDMDDEEREREEYEEDNYIRFNLSKKDKNKMLQKQRKKNAIDVSRQMCAQLTG